MSFVSFSELKKASHLSPFSRNVVSDTRCIEARGNGRASYTEGSMRKSPSRDQALPSAGRLFVGCKNQVYEGVGWEASPI
jgi:hypothetical protein